MGRSPGQDVRYQVICGLWKLFSSSFTSIKFEGDYFEDIILTDSKSNQILIGEVKDYSSSWGKSALFYSKKKEGGETKLNPGPILQLWRMREENEDDDFNIEYHLFSSSGISNKIFNSNFNKFKLTDDSWLDPIIQELKKTSDLDHIQKKYELNKKNIVDFLNQLTTKIRTEKDILEDLFQFISHNSTISSRIRMKDFNALIAEFSKKIEGSKFMEQVEILERLTFHQDDNPSLGETQESEITFNLDFGERPVPHAKNINERGLFLQNYDQRSITGLTVIDFEYGYFVKKYNDGNVSEIETLIKQRFKGNYPSYSSSTRIDKFVKLRPQYPNNLKNIKVRFQSQGNTKSQTINNSFYNSIRNPSIGTTIDPYLSYEVSNIAILTNTTQTGIIVNGSHQRSLKLYCALKFHYFHNSPGTIKVKANNISAISTIGVFGDNHVMEIGLNQDNPIVKTFYIKKVVDKDSPLPSLNETIEFHLELDIVTAGVKEKHQIDFCSKLSIIHEPGSHRKEQIKQRLLDGIP